jgi:hypothetical protein
MNNKKLLSDRINHVNMKNKKLNKKVDNIYNIQNLISDKLNNFTTDI